MAEHKTLRDVAVGQSATVRRLVGEGGFELSLRKGEAENVLVA